MKSKKVNTLHKLPKTFTGYTFGIPPPPSEPDPWFQRDSSSWFETHSRTSSGLNCPELMRWEIIRIIIKKCIVFFLFFWLFCSSLDYVALLFSITSWCVLLHLAMNKHEQRLLYISSNALGGKINQHAVMELNYLWPLPQLHLFIRQMKYS